MDYNIRSCFGHLHERIPQMGSHDPLEASSGHPVPSEVTFDP